MAPPVHIVRESLLACVNQLLIACWQFRARGCSLLGRASKLASERASRQTAFDAKNNNNNNQLCLQLRAARLLCKLRHRKRRTGSSTKEPRLAWPRADIGRHSAGGRLRNGPNNDNINQRVQVSVWWLCCFWRAKMGGKAAPKSFSASRVRNKLRAT